MAVTFFGGRAGLAVAGHAPAGELQPRDGILLVNLVWVALTVCSALPLMWRPIPGLSWTDACFEAMSALTATGATAC